MIAGTLRCPAAVVLLAASGCYDKSVEGGASIYHFSTGAAIAVIAGALFLAALGWWLRRTAVWYLGWFAMAGAAFLLAIVVPILYSDRVAVSADGFTARYGFAFAPTEQSVPFAGLSDIRCETIRTVRRSRREMTCTYRDGGIVKVPVGDLLINAVGEIFDRARAKGVVVFDWSEK